MPGAGALSPSMVMNEPRMVMSLVSRMLPATSKTTVRLLPATAVRRLPGPASSRFVTRTTAPPAPPRVGASMPDVPVTSPPVTRAMPTAAVAAARVPTRMRSPDLGARLAHDLMGDVSAEREDRVAGIHAERRRQDRRVRDVEPVHV